MDIMIMLMLKFNKEHLSIVKFSILNGMRKEVDCLNKYHLKEMRDSLLVIWTESQQMLMMRK